MSRQPELTGHVVAIVFAAPRLLRGFAGRIDADVPLYTDPDRAIYRAFGLGRGSVLRVWLDPRVLWRYQQLLRSGMRPSGSQQDTLQLGGDAVVDADGRVRWVYRSSGPEDRPAATEVANALRLASKPWSSPRSSRA